jgi:hypothetical protein
MLEKENMDVMIFSENNELFASLVFLLIASVTPFETINPSDGSSVACRC